eukprot:scaffold1598_cov100-Skeletonema_dohrnii-CCMP3373.AAC.8
MQPATVTSSPSYAHGHATTDILTIKHQSSLSLISPTRVALPLSGGGGMQGSHHRQPTIKQAAAGLATLIAAKK